MHSILNSVQFHHHGTDHYNSISVFILISVRNEPPVRVHSRSILIVFAIAPKTKSKSNAKSNTVAAAALVAATSIRSNRIRNNNIIINSIMYAVFCERVVFTPCVCVVCVVCVFSFRPFILSVLFS